MGQKEILRIRKEQERATQYARSGQVREWSPELGPMAGFRKDDGQNGRVSG